MHDNGKKGRGADAADDRHSPDASADAPDRPVWAKPDGDIETDFDKVAERAAAMAGEDPAGEPDDWTEMEIDAELDRLDAAEADRSAPGEADIAGDPDPAEVIARLEAEKDDLTDRLLRVVADMDNLRKRTERDLADTRKYGLSKFAGDLLTVGDNLQRALQAVSEEALDADTGPLKGLLDGVEMTARELDKVLEKHGVTRIDPAGEKFDPHRHQAMYQADNPDVPNGTVTEVIQAGYLIGDRVLRAAMVGVARSSRSADGQGAAAGSDTGPAASGETAAGDPDAKPGADGESGVDAAGDPAEPKAGDAA